MPAPPFFHEREVFSAARPWLVVRVELIAESEWTIVECEATSRAVVTIKVALAVADADPVRHKRGKAVAELLREQHHFSGGA